MPTNAIWIDGQSTLPQARPASAVEWVWLDGQSGLLPVGPYAAAGGSSIPVAALAYSYYRQLRA